MEITKFTYKGHKILFDFNNNNQLINATQMAKPFGKRPSKFLGLDSTKEYVSALSKKSDVLSTVITLKGNYSNNRPQGTWMHRLLALRFAQWLNAEFAIWVDERIMELLTKGSVSIAQETKPTSAFDALELMFKGMKENRSMMLELKDDFKEIKAKITTKNEEYYTISGYASLRGLKVVHTKAIALGKKATKLSKEEGLPVGAEYDAKYGKINSYHTDILKTIFSNYSN